MASSSLAFEELRPRRSRRLLRVLRIAFVTAALLPLGVPALESFTWGKPLGALLRNVYALQCHQRVLRTVVLAGVPLPVCARCFGIYLGMGLAGLVCRPRLRRGPLTAWIVLGALVVLLDVATERVQLRGPSTWLRIATGATLAYGAALAMLEAVRPRRG